MKTFAPGQLRGFAAGAALLGLAAFVSTPAFSQEVDLRCAPFGSITYTVGNAIQDVVSKSDSKLRVTNAEGPGSTAMTVNMLAGGDQWKRTIACTSLLDYIYAEQGVKPFFNKKYPDIRSDVKILFNGFYGAIGILTTDPTIKSASDLDGKDLALGRRAQAHWGGLPALFFQDGMPDTKPEMEFMGTTPSHEALAEGRATSIISQIVMSPDGSKAYKPGVVNRLFASGRPIYLVGFPDEAFERAKAAGVDFQPITVDNKAIPEATGDRSVKWIYSPASFAVRKDFPEDIAYRLTKLMIAHAGELPVYGAMLNVIASGEGLLGAWTTRELHPGAARAFREAGLLK